jgi:diacylglycerol kinase family enzyme
MISAREEPLLSSLERVATFEASDNIQYKRKSCRLAIDEQKLYCWKIEGQKQLFEAKVCDIIGAQYKLSKKSRKTDEIFYLLQIFVYPNDNSSCCCSKPSLMRNKIVFELEINDENTCINLTNAINCASRNIPICRNPGSHIVCPPPQRNFIVFVNPVGGQGLAVSIWEKTVKPFLEQANINIDLLITQRADHAKDSMTERDLSDIHGVVIIGGDGLIFEVINGISKRPDSAHIMQTLPLIPVPGGSGNGLAKSILYESGEVYSPLTATYVGVKGSVSPLKISITSTLNASHISFLIMGWGLVSDTDILSNSLRWMGEMRFFLAGAYNILSRKLYRGRLSILLDPEALEKNDTHLGGELVLPPLTEPLTGAHWQVIEDDFLLIWVVQTSHSSSSIFSGPGVTMNDGLFTIMVVRHTTSICSMIDMMDRMDHGHHFENSNCEVFKTKAYRLEPLTTEGLFTLDGEEIEYGPIQGIMQSSALRVMKTSNNHDS